MKKVSISVKKTEQKLYIFEINSKFTTLVFLKLHFKLKFRSKKVYIFDTLIYQKFLLIFQILTKK